MARLKRVYIETSIISYLTARKNRDLLAAAWQKITREFWDRQRHYYQLFISGLVVEECRMGNAEAAQRRLLALRGLAELDIDDDVKHLAAAILTHGGVPRKAEIDALHIAIAAIGKVDYLLTWNCRHLDNPVTKPKVRAICLNCGYQCPEICTPFEITEGAKR